MTTSLFPGYGTNSPTIRCRMHSTKLPLLKGTNQTKFARRLLRGNVVHCDGGHHLVQLPCLIVPGLGRNLLSVEKAAHNSVVLIFDTDNHITPHYITSHHIISYDITSHRTKSHHIKFHRIASHRIPILETNKRLHPSAPRPNELYLLILTEFHLREWRARARLQLTLTCGIGGWDTSAAKV